MDSKKNLVRFHLTASYSPTDRTMEEMERTKQFGKEVVDLLRHQPHCRMPFSKFIPTYHHHFGRQCKLSYYGFTKLMELFEAIPDILMVSFCTGFIVVLSHAKSCKFGKWWFFFFFSRSESFHLKYILEINCFIYTVTHVDLKIWRCLKWNNSVDTFDVSWCWNWQAMTNYDQNVQS